MDLSSPMTLLALHSLSENQAGRGGASDPMLLIIWMVLTVGAMIGFIVYMVWSRHKSIKEFKKMRDEWEDR